MAEQVPKKRGNCPCSEKLSPAGVSLASPLPCSCFFLKQVGFPVLQSHFLTKIELLVKKEKKESVTWKECAFKFLLHFHKGLIVSLQFIKNGWHIYYGNHINVIFRSSELWCNHWRWSLESFFHFFSRYSNTEVQWAKHTNTKTTLFKFLFCFPSRTALATSF